MGTFQEESVDYGQDEEEGVLGEHGQESFAILCQSRGPRSVRCQCSQAEGVKSQIALSTMHLE